MLREKGQCSRFKKFIKYSRIAKLEEIKQLMKKHDQLYFLFKNNKINYIKI